MYMPSVVIVNCENTFDSQFEEGTGQPISGQTQITFRTINTPSREQIKAYFTGLNKTIGRGR
jgi:hypothetical protein